MHGHVQPFFDYLLLDHNLHVNQVRANCLNMRIMVQIQGYFLLGCFR